MAVSIAVETPLRDAIRALVADLNAHLRPLSPPEFQFQMTAEQMAGDDTTVFVARDDAQAVVGMGALRRHDASLGEVKRMFSIPAMRGTGIGWRLLQAIEAEAIRQKLERLVLETGGTTGFEPAWALYERAGFTRRGAFLDYPNSEFSRFYEKMLPR
ncbi:GNAT family N-acetyltransferase [Aurantimonas aggregata]|uniref:GNAT family N-acetyltransferase n=1 Tax=Aurantimonas aggregata TaxID=2047720 RepID=A0A6L9MLM5_9HYPH|nr:GNAT family N-acetyltransferase [Aurantimonas aggregata]NDV88625.1 GNAT family N-acetyltransferase [Aurantimonas aggregata]